MWQDFKVFLIKDNVIGLAIAVILGGTLNKLVGSLVDDIIMPLVGLVSSGDWQELKIPLTDSAALGVGNLLGALVNFVVIGFICWRISKAFVKPAAK